MADRISSDAHGGKHHDLIAKAVCLVLALILWIYVMEAENPDWEETIEGVPIELINTDDIEIDSGLMIYGGYSSTVDVTLRGKKNLISGLTADDIKATADVSEISEAGEYQLDVSLTVPDDTDIVSRSADTVTVEVDRRERITVDIRCRYSGLVIEEGFTQGDAELSVSTVTVTGPSRYLAEIDHAEVLVPDLGHVTGSVTAYGSISLVDKNGGVVSNPYVTMSNSEVRVFLPIYANKEVPLTVEFVNGFYNNENVEISLDRQTINIRGDAAVINDIDHILVTRIDEKLISDDTSFEANLVLPDGVENMDGVTHVNVSIKHKGTEKRSLIIPIDDSCVVNPQGLAYTLSQDSLMLTLRGDPGELYQVSPENITAKIDLSSYSGVLPGQSATVRVPVVLSFPSTETVYEIGVYYVDVTISGAVS